MLKNYQGKTSGGFNIAYLQFLCQSHVTSNIYKDFNVAYHRYSNMYIQHQHNDGNCKRLERGAFRARVELLDEIFLLFLQWMCSCVRLPASCVVYARAPPATESAAVPDGVCFEVVPGIISQRGCKSQPLATFGEKGVPLVCTRSTVRRQSRRSTRWPREPRKQSRAARRRISPIQSQHYPGSNVTISGVNCTFGSPLGYRSAFTNT